MAAYAEQIAAQARDSEVAKRLQTIVGVGPTTAAALVATVSAPQEFSNGRQFSAWLGLTPKQHSTGGKTRLGRITKRGDAYVRTLLILGAKSTLQAACARRRNCGIALHQRGSPYSRVRPRSADAGEGSSHG